MSKASPTYNKKKRFLSKIHYLCTRESEIGEYDSKQTFQHLQGEIGFGGPLAELQERLKICSFSLTAKNCDTMSQFLLIFFRKFTISLIFHFFNRKRRPIFGGALSIIIGRGTVMYVFTVEFAPKRITNL